ncbi:hypothetical protein BDR26DRAFT_1004884 [Obelidium mucronatum]|nr:hypothetical protein BDR26DRAFT_1004884 [Obelidium mucronatum]
MSTGGGRSKLGQQDTSVLEVLVFSMIKFCEASANDAAGFTLLGLLREKQGVFGEAVAAFGKAVAAFGKAVDICRKQGRRGGKEELGQCLANYARALCSAGLYGESIEVYTELREVTDVGSSRVLTRVGVVDKLLNTDKVDASTTVTKVVRNSAASLLGSSALDVSWSNLLAADSSVIRGLVRLALGNQEVATGTFQNAFTCIADSELGEA